MGEGIGVALGAAAGIGAMFALGPAGAGLMTTTIGMNATTMLMASTGMMAMGQIQAGVNAAEMREYNAEMAEWNATVVQRQTDAEAKLKRRQRAHLIGRQRTDYAVAGVDVPGDEVFDETDILVKEDLIALQMQADIKKFGFWGQATRERLLGSQAMSKGLLDAGQTILTTGYELELTPLSNKTDFNVPDSSTGHLIPEHLKGTGKPTRIYC